MGIDLDSGVVGERKGRKDALEKSCLCKANLIFARRKSGNAEEALRVCLTYSEDLLCKLRIRNVDECVGYGPDGRIWANDGNKANDA